ncbi:MAG TPA: PAS domain-containing protein [Novosphingobium sp.]|nr:PAS domain-containing protein [Novosphingobium sp.]
MAQADASRLHPGCYGEVTVAELIRQFAHWRKFSERTPISITNHGHITHILMGIEAFSSIASPDHVPDCTASQNDPAHRPMSELIDWLPLGVLVCDEAMVVQQANRVLFSMTLATSSTVIGQSLWVSFPALVGTLFQTYIQHALSSGEPCTADLPSPFREGNWIHLAAFPLGSGVCVVLRDITEEVRHHRLADVKEAIFHAMTVHGGVGYMRLSARGAIERIDEPLCKLVGLPPKRLLHAQALDLVPVHARVAFREHLEHVLTGHGAVQFVTELMSNEGRIVRVNCAMAELRGVYGGEGCVVLLTPAIADS